MNYKQLFNAAKKRLPINEALKRRLPKKDQGIIVTVSRHHHSDIPPYKFHAWDIKDAFDSVFEKEDIGIHQLQLQDILERLKTEEYVTITPSRDAPVPEVPQQGPDWDPQSDQLLDAGDEWEEEDSELDDMTFWGSSEAGTYGFGFGHGIQNVSRGSICYISIKPYNPARERRLELSGLSHDQLVDMVLKYEATRY